MLCSGGKVSVGHGPGHSGAHSYWNSEDRELQDVLDARAPLPSVFCVRSEKRGAVSLRVELDTPVEGNLELLSAEAEGQSVIRIETRQQIYSVRGFHAGENPVLHESEAHSRLVPRSGLLGFLLGCSPYS